MWGRGAQDLREMPPHIQEIDHIICCAPGDIRIILIKFYSTGGTYYDKALALGLDKRTFKRRIDRADYYVHSNLDNRPQKEPDSRRMPRDVGIYRAPAIKPTPVLA